MGKKERKKPHGIVDLFLANRFLPKRSRSLRHQQWKWWVVQHGVDFCILQLLLQWPPGSCWCLPLLAVDRYSLLTSNRQAGWLTKHVQYSIYLVKQGRVCGEVLSFFNTYVGVLLFSSAFFFFSFSGALAAAGKWSCQSSMASLPCRISLSACQACQACHFPRHIGDPSNPRRYLSRQGQPRSISLIQISNTATSVAQTNATRVSAPACTRPLNPRALILPTWAFRTFY